MKARVHEPLDIAIEGTSPCVQPFLARVEGLFEGPGGEALRIPGFYDGGAWKVRFAPSVAGRWRYRVAALDIEGPLPSGEIEAVASDNRRVHGVLGIDPDHPYHFRFADGEHHFMMPYECDWLWALELADPSGRSLRALLDPVAEAGFNGIILNLYAHDTTWRPGQTRVEDYGPPPAYPWEGTNERPDHSRMNCAFFAAFDRVMRALAERGMVAHLFLKVYNKGVSWPERRSVEEDLFFRYVVARYQAFPLLVWDFSKESFYEPDKDYIRERVACVRALDAYGHLLTVHDDAIFYGLHGGAVDFVTLQQHSDFHSAILVERSLRRSPVFNSELGYEWGPGGEKDLTYGRGQSPEELVHRAWLTVMAGGYPAYYYTYTAWDVILPEHRPPGYRYWRILQDFMTSIRWWELDPLPARRLHSKGPALYGPGGEMVFYVAAGGSVRLDRSLWGSGWKGAALNTLSGERRDFGPGDLVPGRYEAGVPIAANPFAGAPAVLHIRRA